MRTASPLRSQVWRASRIAASGLVLFAALSATLQAATLDVAVDGNDLVFTWDTATDDLLRGTTPDALAPWLTFVTSPLRVPNENVLRGESAFYRLASGSNMAFRVERTFVVDVPGRAWAVPATLPERHAYGTSFGLLRAWPSLGEITWYDGASGMHDAASRASTRLVGHDQALPRHGGVWLAFTRTTTVTIVGSSDPPYPGIVLADMPPDGLLPYVVFPVPPDGRWQDAMQLLCGERGQDWFDVDGDGVPDECGRDTDADGWPDTGFWHGSRDVRFSASLSLVEMGPPDGATAVGIAVNYDGFSGNSRVINFGSSSRLATCDGLQVSGSYYQLPVPFSVPRW